jgi:hypothetical protein
VLYRPQGQGAIGADPNRMSWLRLCARKIDHAAPLSQGQRGEPLYAFPSPRQGQTTRRSWQLPSPLSIFLTDFVMARLFRIGAVRDSVGSGCQSSGPTRTLRYHEIKGILGLREKGVATQARSPPMVALHKNM